MNTTLNVLTFNVGNGRAHPAGLVAMLSDCGADIVALQEVSQTQGEALDEGLREIYQYRSIFPGGFAGKAIISRFPIIEVSQLNNFPDRPDLRTVISVDGIRLTVISAHPPPPKFHRTGFHFEIQTINQINSLAKLAKSEAPSVLMGDFNLVSNQPEYKIMVENELMDAFLESGSGFGNTLPRRVGPWRRLQWLNQLLSGIPLIPVARVDYIWFTSPIKCKACWVGQDSGSDHLPLFANLVIESKLG